MQNGWIKLHRKLLENSISSNPIVAWCWVRFLLEASHKDHDFYVGNKKIHLKAGQFIWGEKAWGKILRVSPSTAKRIKNCLKSDGLIDEQPTNRFTLITIKKWKDYQKLDERNDEQMTNKRRTDDEQMTTNKNDKKEKNDKKLLSPIGDNKELEKNLDPVGQLFDIFYKTVNPALNWGNKTSRSSAEWLIAKFGLDHAKRMTEAVCAIQGKPYAPVVTTPYQMKLKLAELKLYFEREKKNNNSSFTGKSYE